MTTNIAALDCSGPCITNNLFKRWMSRQHGESCSTTKDSLENNSQLEMSFSRGMEQLCQTWNLSLGMEGRIWDSWETVFSAVTIRDVMYKECHILIGQTIWSTCVHIIDICTWAKLQEPCQLMYCQIILLFIWFSFFFFFFFEQRPCTGLEHEASYDPTPAYQARPQWRFIICFMLCFILYCICLSF